MKTRPFFFYLDGDEYSPRIRAWRAAMRVMVIGLGEHIPPEWRKDFDLGSRLIAATRERTPKEEWRRIVAKARDHYAAECEENRRICEACRNDQEADYRAR